MKSGESFNIDKNIKKSIILGIVILGIIKFCELPYQETVSIQALLSVILVFGFIALIYLNKITKKILIIIFSIGLIVNILIVVLDFSIDILDIVKTIIIGAVIIGLIVYETKKCLTDILSKAIPIIIGISLVLCCMGGITAIHPSVPDFENSDAVGVVDELKNLSTNNTQKWAVITGGTHQDMEYTYHFMKNGIHAVNAYYAYYLNSMIPTFYNIGGKIYSIADYIVDTNYVHTGEFYNENYTSIRNGVPITVPEYILPNVFIFRDNSIINVNIEEFYSDKVVATSDFKSGDVVILKTAYYEGWKVNGKNSIPVGNMIGYELTSDTDKVIFSFEPWYFIPAITISLIGAISLVLIIIRRNKINKLLK